MLPRFLYTGQQQQEAAEMEAATGTLRSLQTTHRSMTEQVHERGGANVRIAKFPTSVRPNGLCRRLRKLPLKRGEELLNLAHHLIFAM
jgi:hypothetical protein